MEIEKHADILDGILERKIAVHGNGFDTIPGKEHGFNCGLTEKRMAYKALCRPGKTIEGKVRIGAHLPYRAGRLLVIIGLIKDCTFLDT